MRNHYTIELTAAGLYRIRTCFPFHSTRRTGVSSTICNRKSTPTFPPDKKNLQKFAPFFAISEICPTFAPLLAKAGLPVLSIKHSESCLSGRKSHTRNVVYALRRTGGSNPSLSVKSSHFLQKKRRNTNQAFLPSFSLSSLFLTLRLQRLLERLPNVR